VHGTPPTSVDRHRSGAPRIEKTRSAGCQAPPQFTAQDQSATQALFDSTVAWFRTANWSAWAGEFSEDAVFYPPHEAPKPK
jgi:hypothetical protein